MAENERCTHIKDDGARCEVTFGLSSEGLCYHHDPERAEARRRSTLEGARKGGRATKAKLRTTFDPDRLPPLDSLEAAQTWLEVVGRARAEGILQHSDMSAYARLISEWVKTHNARAIDERLDELRKKLEEHEKELAQSRGRDGLKAVR